MHRLHLFTRFFAVFLTVADILDFSCHCTPRCYYMFFFLSFTVKSVRVVNPIRCDGDDYPRYRFYIPVVIFLVYT